MHQNGVGTVLFRYFIYQRGWLELAGLSIGLAGMIETIGKTKNNKNNRGALPKAKQNHWENKTNNKKNNTLWENAQLSWSLSRVTFSHRVCVFQFLFGFPHGFAMLSREVLQVFSFLGFPNVFSRCPVGLRPLPPATRCCCRLLLLLADWLVGFAGWLVAAAGGWLCWPGRAGCTMQYVNTVM